MRIVTGYDRDRARFLDSFQCPIFATSAQAQQPYAKEEQQFFCGRGTGSVNV
jgi:hypothetical protein